MTNYEVLREAVDNKNAAELKRILGIISGGSLGVCERHCPYMKECVRDGMIECRLSDDEELQIWFDLKSE